METATGALPNLPLAIPSYHIAGGQRPNYYMGRHLKGTVPEVTFKDKSEIQDQRQLPNKVRHLGLETLSK